MGPSGRPETRTSVIDTDTDIDNGNAADTSTGTNINTNTETTEITRRRKEIFGHVLVVVVVATTVFAGLQWLLFTPLPTPLPSSITFDAFAFGLDACRRNADAVANANASFRDGGAPSLPRRGNPRHRALAKVTVLKPDSDVHHPASDAPILFKNATVWDGVGNRLANTDVSIGYGIILKIGSALTIRDVVNAGREYHAKLSLSDLSTFAFTAADVEVVDLEGRVLSPGLVDMHSHVVVGSIPGFWGDNDGNEMGGSPTEPQLRVLDAINPLDKAIDLIASGGVTTSLILPGSALLIGGQGAAIKMLKTSTNSADEMLLNFGMENGDGKAWKFLKMACGENPKAVFGHFPCFFPWSRLGNVWGFIFIQIIFIQDDWCETASSLEQQFKGTAHQHMSKRYPNDLIDESLVALFRGDVLLQVHCYQVNDMEMMLRHKHEFGFNIAAFHHATEAYLLADKLAEENVSVAIFADFSLYKREAYKHSVHAGKILNEAGVKVAYKSDHGAVNAQNLIHEAARAAHFGMDKDAVFMAVTSVPAERIGAGWRIGRIAENYDADIVIWDRPPLELGAHPLRVVIDGYTIVSQKFTPIKPAPAPAVKQITPVLDRPKKYLASYTVSNIGKIFAQESEVLNGTIVVENGIITCLGQKCKPAGIVFNLHGGVVIPGLISAAAGLGLEEISTDASTTDGILSVEDVLAGFAFAKDGLRVGGDGKLLESAWKAGVLTGISAPKSEGLVQGVSVAFRTTAEKYKNAVVKSDVAVHITVGNEAKDTYSNSISSQFGHLRKLLESPKPDSPFNDVVSGKLPLVATVHDPNDISKLLQLLATTAPKVKLVISGATGAWVVADEIAQANATVHLLPPRCQQDSWEKRWCRTIGRGEPTTYEILKAAGVKVSINIISVAGTNEVRSLLFEAGWMTVGDHSYSSGIVVEDQDAVAAVTWNIADAFGLQDGTGKILLGKRASFVGLDGGPVGFGYNIQILCDAEKVTTLPIQE
ncbi:hypothetical protein HK100_011628 [Physocladia obscura]|uniref:Amidohydrolase-related domain-containing protein n=1 Tax=Physocladia obscura TaxID=109957 RepID=A0AAD5XE13_9FUNG|nr:hypothetical protein HK100_011628 [Physocladia obscura]